MAYFTRLFTVDTYEAYLTSDRTVAGFQESQAAMASRLSSGDKLLGYVTGISRWTTVAEVIDGPFIDHTPIFLPESDPYVVRFRIRPSVCLQLPDSIPIKDNEVFSNLSFTRGRENGYWLGPLRRSLHHLDDADGVFLEKTLLRQTQEPKKYPFDEGELQSFRGRTIKRAEGIVSVTVPEDDHDATEPNAKSNRDSIKAQADLAKLGEAMGFRVWLPRQDRAAVLQHWTPLGGTLLDSLPLNYDDTTLKTIEQIDVIWLKGRAIQRAFEVEHTTAIYSGLLRMADLLALQPNMDIALHIVAPGERRDKVLGEIKRPVFSLIERQPLSRRCSFLAYESLHEILAIKHLSHTQDSVLEEYVDVPEP